MGRGPRRMADSDSYSVPGNGWQSSGWPALKPPPSAFDAARPRFRQRYWLHALLFLLTLYSTTLVGARLAHNFAHNLPAFDIESDIATYSDMWADPGQLASGLPFSLTLLAILLAHEFGHYLACVYYQVDASLPYFLPAPTFTGTLGAFIR